MRKLMLALVFALVPIGGAVAQDTCSSSAVSGSFSTTVDFGGQVDHCSVSSTTLPTVVFTAPPVQPAQEGNAPLFTADPQELGTTGQSTGTQILLSGLLILIGCMIVATARYDFPFKQLRERRSRRGWEMSFNWVEEMKSAMEKMSAVYPMSKGQTPPPLPSIEEVDEEIARSQQTNPWEDAELFKANMALQRSRRQATLNARRVYNRTPTR